MTAPGRRIPLPLVVVFGLAGVVVLCALGTWQLQRMAWKEGLLADIGARLSSMPEPVPDDPDPVADRFRAVEAEGTVARPVFTVFGTWRNFGAGVRLVAPLDTDRGRILVDLGVAPWAAGTPPAQAAALAPAEGSRLSVAGNLDWPREGTAGPGTDILARDVAAMAERAGARPLLLVARSADPPAGPTPVPVSAEGIPNSHLGYAVQWFGLAAVWAGMTAYLAWRISAKTA